MKKIIIGVVTSIMGVGLVAGCSSTSKQANPKSEPHVTTVTEADNGREVTLSKESKLVVELPSNQTTGYSWQVGGPIDDKVLVHEETRYVRPGTNRIGAGGTEQLQFRAIGDGKTEVRLDYARPWERSAAPAKVFIIQVSVKE